MVSDTSLAAYYSVLPYSDEHKSAILGVIKSRGNATVSEISDDTGIFHKTTQNILSTLRTAGIVNDTGARRKNSRGRSEVAVAISHALETV